ncbi:SCO family protein [Flammeovirga yaeyamensis]|uniref:SCO family protein n=1 Tax=Flammeovirga yaeyamensis TaxID=367791 RepID=A0AAX1NC52_9BACT|nr:MULTISPECIES: SCO family protein [Flammeovirga]ANQ48655.1 SCO family protein [Flammeovirga sp. MY04]MBB3698736.1 protein SCO1/2 [Flammeovirga yaeyamensis]NMF37322.1 SCO family protein [Flammeovirga yaeyamensis]QWG03860.1 SCO family protein [Flammeovirga yaeyamensis]
MNKPNQKKWVFLFLLIGIPLVILVFLKSFGKNEYRLEPAESLQIYNLKSVNCTPNEIDGVHRIPEFEFLNQDSTKFSNKNLEGSIYVADFFFTSCPDICKAMTSSMLRVQERFKNEKELQLVSFSIDPSYDTPKVLSSYAERHGIDTNRWNLLTGDKQTIMDLGQCGFYITAKEVMTGKSASLSHSDKLILVDKQKRIRGIYSGTDQDDVKRLLTEISLLLLEDNGNIKSETK